ncbi:MAG: uncharacterized protein Athens071426_453 [Parcubacteria group bacterium Athens0714_26]|nr:MAG: uncharacterized protein Athens101426_43 [Parcubacteria group bacterium Athens1014_26]TSD02606.1 MAG: uncharacterized protein Athens071426_453 [Parcubacteria group bacterium Athens0714_26]
MKDIFLLEDNGMFVLFAPLKGLILEINNEEKQKIERLLNQSNFCFENIINLFPEIDRAKLIKKELMGQNNILQTTKFCPDSLVLFPTFDCNLRCIYCYSKAGEKKINMNWQIAKTAIDFVIENAKSNGSKENNLEFHGGGEPTWNWPVFEKAFDYFKEKTTAEEITPNISVATNGVLSKTQLNWITNHFNSVQVSLDGTREIQNFQRPTAGGGKSFEIVYNAIRTLLENKINVTIHCTITEKGVDNIPEIVRFFLNDFPGAAIHLEPACKCGRCAQTEQEFPNPDSFIQGFIESEKMIRAKNSEIYYSGTSSKLTEFRQNFCGASLPNFIVTPTGLVTACHEVAEKEHAFANYFIYGFLDQQNNNFVFDSEKIKKLQSCSIHSYCENCFAKYFCMGECLVKSLNKNGERNFPNLNPRCKINRELTKYFIFQKIREQVLKKEVWHGQASKAGSCS